MSPMVLQAEAPKDGNFISAGVLAYSTDPATNETVLLLGREFRGENELKYCPGEKWKSIGGTRDNDETTIQTASREFDEETGVDKETGKGGYGKNYILNRINPKLRIKHPRHASYIYLVEVDYKKISDFPTQRSELKQLAWVPAAVLYNAIDSAKKKHPGRFSDNMTKARCYAELPEQYTGEHRMLYPPLVDDLENDTLFRNALKVALAK
ncbi:NUDIX hydrolase [Gimesia fumaroli]|nr:NUDIX hydrolase [Gimesia fumaroli]